MTCSISWEGKAQGVSNSPPSLGQRGHRTLRAGPLLPPLLSSVASAKLTPSSQRSRDSQPAEAPWFLGGQRGWLALLAQGFNLSFSKQ